MHDYDEMLDWLYGLRVFGMKPGLERISEAMEKLGNPQNKLKIIHVTGTNGKGSVCAMIDSILEKSGFNVGLFTSPHLVDFRERLQVNRKKISKHDAMRITEMIKKTNTELTFFEFTTAMALQYFYEQKVDYAVIEVGMGGRYDATNIVKPVATVITNLSMDHTDWLGETLDKITHEKAGIVKEGVPLFTTADNEVIKQACKEKNAQFVFVSDEEDNRMNGAFQRKNAALAAAVARHLHVKEEKIREGLASVQWPARLEFIEKNVLLDCCHNTDGVEKATEFVKMLKHRKLIIVFGVMKNKDYKGMISRLPEHSKIILTRPKIERSLNPMEMKNLCKDPMIIENAGEAYEYAKSIAGSDDLILLCGSCYLAGEIIAHINKIDVHPLMFVQ